MFKEIEEHPSHFVLHHKDGHELRVAKSGLSKRTLQHIQKLAQGGEVKKPEAPVSQEQANAFNQGFNSQTIAAKGQNNPKLQQSNVRNYADGGTIQDPTVGLVPDDGQSYTQFPQAQMLQQEIPQEAAPEEKPFSEKTGFEQISDFAKSIGEKAKAAYNAVDSTQLGHTLLSGGQGTPPQQQAPPGNPNVQPAVMTNQSQQPKFVRANLGEPQKNNNTMLAALNTGPAYTNVAQEQIKGAQQEYQAESKLGKAQASALEKGMNEYQDFWNTAQAHLQDLDKERQAVIQDIQTNQINPNRYFESMNTGQKISNAIGLLLGGIGGGLLHQENPVMKFINAQVDRDIEAQKTNLGKKNTLLEANLRQYGNMQNAINATRLHYLAMTEGMMQKAAAQSKDPLALARFTQAKASIDAQQIPLQRQSALLQAAFHRNQTGENFDPSPLINAMVPEKQQEKAFAEMDEIKELHKTGQIALDTFDKVANMTAGGKFSPKLRAALVKPLIADISTKFAKRFSDTDAKYLESIFPEGLMGPETQSAARDQLVKLFNSKMHSSILSGNGIPIPQLQTGRKYQTTPGFQQAGMMPVGMKK